MSDLIETTPRMELAIQDIEHLVEELRAYHAIYSPLFQRREQREAAHTYLQGLLAPLPRKSIEPMVLALDRRAPPRPCGPCRPSSVKGRGTMRRLLHQHWKEVEQDLGEDEGVLMVDGSDFPKQGIHSVGVKRQYCGELGKRANCQAGVFVGYVSPQGYTMLDRRLYLPAEWLTDDAYAERRRQCGMPARRSPFKTKPALAQEMLAAVVKSPSCGAAGWWRTRHLGTTQAFWMGWRGWACGTLPKCPTPPGSGQSVPAIHMPPWRGRGRRPQRERLVEGAPEARTVGRWPRPCPPRRGHARRSRKAARGPWWRSLLPCGWSPCGTPCQVLTSGWCCVGTSRRGS